MEIVTKRSCSRLKEDRISQLPDPLICHILSHLPTKQAVKTSVLSTRWRSLWLWVPSLEMQSHNFPNCNDFVSFGNRFFSSDRFSCLHKLKLSGMDIYRKRVNDASYVTSWIDAAVKRKIQHLYLLLMSDDLRYKTPKSLYICETLVSLKLLLMPLVNANFVSLPCLKTLRLKEVYFHGKEAMFERLVSGCPVLEELKIVECMDAPEIFRVHSLSLKRLKIRMRPHQNRGGFGFVIDAPLLHCLRINDNKSQSYIINNLDSNAKLDISLGFGEELHDEASVLSIRNSICDFLPGISKVGEMIINLDTFKLIHHYSKLEPLPQFDYLSRLDVRLCMSDLEWLPTFLEHCVNLKSLALFLDNDRDEMSSKEMNRIRFSCVPQCLLSSLRFVDIKSVTSGFPVEMKLLRYFLKSSVILEKLTICLDYFGNRNVITKKLLKIRRPSEKCQVVVL